MMRNTLFLLLSLLAAVPPVLAAQPVFHCASTGVEGFVMQCCQEDGGGCCGAVEEIAPEPRSCCSSEAQDCSEESAPSTNTRVRSDGASICGCCSVSFIRLLAAETRGASCEWLFTLNVTLSTAEIELISETEPNLTRAPIGVPHDRPPAVPLPILYSTLLV